MKYRYIALGAVLAIAGVAHAQQNWVEINDSLLVIDPLGMTVEELDDFAVHNADGVQVGTLAEILRSKEDDSVAVTLDVGNFLGVGEKEVLIPVEKLSADAEGIALDMTKPELEALPEYPG